LIQKQLQKLYQILNRYSGDRLSILKNTLVTFSDARASQSAASLAYYAFFSLFPLLLVIIAGSSYFLNRQLVFDKVIQVVQQVIPVSNQLISENLQQVLAARGAVGLIGLLTLLWSASGFFTSLAYNINLAWPQASQRNFFEKRLVGLGMVTSLGGLLLLSLAFNWIMPLVKLSNLSPMAIYLWKLISSAGSWLTIFLIYLAIYRWVPSTEVHWSASLLGGLIASIAWIIATSGFSWYLRSGLGKYQLVYGSLGTIVALLFLIFILATITLFGAHLSAAIDRWVQENHI